ncbi:hypothetical protein [Nocardia wallacei]|uniref:hypothetical protein n=1 Tax=Nocardia wallacei TaxID=480035 RepID=UPI002453CCFC|nr:hypothetical protein [Nocardia wallacei]
MWWIIEPSPEEEGEMQKCGRSIPTRPAHIRLGYAHSGDARSAPRLVEVLSSIGDAVAMTENWGRHMHPDTVAALESGRNLVHIIYDMLEEVDRVRARRPSPSSRVIPEIDGIGRMTDLYIAPGTIASFMNSQELVDEIMAAIRDSTADALRQHEIIVQGTVWPDIPSPR